MYKLFDLRFQERDRAPESDDEDLQLLMGMCNIVSYSVELQH